MTNIHCTNDSFVFERDKHTPEHGAHTLEHDTHFEYDAHVLEHDKDTIG